MSNTIQTLSARGQSIWCDNISRQMLDAGELRRLIDLGVCGVTSNPTIFMKAITGSTAYDERFSALLAQGLDMMALYEGLVLPDIADAADQLRPVYDRTEGLDGYVSLEVNPKLAHDTAGTLAEARRLSKELNRPNILIKVPATDEGMPAVETLIAEGINVNVTLIFGIDAYEQVMHAYLNGLRRLRTNGGDLSKAASVASFFISRVDTLVDKLLDEKAAEGKNVKELYGLAAVANAKLAYARFEQVFDAAGEFGDLAADGARIQRPLWASTSTKNPNYPDTKYVDDLVGPHTVNTVPPATIEAALDHGATVDVIRDNVDGESRVIDRLAELGIGIKTVTDQLRTEGVAAFVRSFDELLEDLGRKRDELGAAR